MGTIKYDLEAMGLLSQEEIGKAEEVIRKISVAGGPGPDACMAFIRHCREIKPNPYLFSDKAEKPP